MSRFLSRLKGRDGSSKAKAEAQPKGAETSKLLGEDAWLRKSVEPEEVQELTSGCVIELKARCLDTPFLLLPFRPTSDPSAARNFIRLFFNRRLHGEQLLQELRLSDPMVLCSIIKWCWSRLSGGVVGWEAYELFKMGESDSNMARDSFTTFIPLSVDSDARSKIIFDFFDLLSAIAAHSRSNGLGGRKLSRLAGWWAFEQSEDAKSFEVGYKSWIAAADATCHLFFAYLRSLSSSTAKALNGISSLPISLQKLIHDTEYPPQESLNLHTGAFKVGMIVDSVSPTPFALLRRATHFHYRDDDRELRELAEYGDPVDALTDECRRVLKLISSTNQSHVSSRMKDPTDSTDASWSRFEDIGFSGAFNDDDDDLKDGLNINKYRPQGLRTTATTKNSAGGRPATPSWADFLSSGFVDEVGNAPSHLLLPPDLSLPPIEVDGHNSYFQDPNSRGLSLEPGELASISKIELDDAFWWVWISSLAGEEHPERKAAFGRCALIETAISGGSWFVVEEMVRGAAPAPEEGAYIAEKKRFWGRSKKNRDVKQRKSSAKYALENSNPNSPAFSTSQNSTFSRNSMGRDPHARIQAAAARLQQKQREETHQFKSRRERNEEEISMKTSSVFTLQPVILNEASPALKWANKYDKDSTREAYLANPTLGRPAEISRESTISLRSPEIQRTNANGSVMPSPLTMKSPPPYSRTPNPNNPTPNAASPEEAPPEQQYHASMSATRTSIDYELLSPDTPKFRKNLNKSSSSTGFKKMFSRNKTQRKPADYPPQASAGREGIEKRSDKKGRRSSLVRKLSGLRKASLTPSIGGRSAAPSPSPAAAMFKNDNFEAISQNIPVVTHVQAESRLPSAHDSLSPVNTNEAQEAREAFSSFDQGPLEDVPAFVPEDEPHSETDDAISAPIPHDLSNGESSPNSPQNDRWAQIRKNAAERASRHLSGETSHNEGENDVASGEESIESRVAKIKARVAQITENTDENHNVKAGASPF
ncbi:hypothetical protein K3495_g2070 [Podosphaera aphanis]|nr:hypothetical protein K3495_g2070 [Podosphaera aphanis]